MGNYYSFMVTDHEFRVKDPKKFIEALKKIGSSQITADNDDGLVYDAKGGNVFWLGGYDALPVIDEDTGDEIDIFPIIQEHIAEDDFASFKIVGQEKLAYVRGDTIIVTKKEVRLKDLHYVEAELKKELGIATKEDLKILGE